VRSHFEDTIENEGTALEETVAPVPAIIFDDMVCFGLDPEIESDEEKSSDPSANG